MAQFELNGIKYRKKPSSNVKMSRAGARLVAIAAMLGGLPSVKVKGGISDAQLRELEELDVIEEYGKIQRKESNLNSRGRSWVVRQFERNFEEVQEGEEDLPQEEEEIQEEVSDVPAVITTEKLGDEGFELCPIEVNEEYLKKWNCRTGGMRGGFLHIAKNGVPVRNTLYRKGGLGGSMKDGYIMLLKYVEDYYDGDFAKKYTKGEKRHLSSRWVIIDKYGEEKVEAKVHGKLSHTGGVICCHEGVYTNIETGYEYCTGNKYMTSKDFLFVNTGWNTRKENEGVMKINIWDGTFEVFPNK